MKRLATAVILLCAALGARAEAGGLPSPVSLVGRHRAVHFVPYVRGDARPKLPQAVRGARVDVNQATHLTHAVRGK
jgi:hypothetical protein